MLMEEGGGGWARSMLVLLKVCAGCGGRVLAFGFFCWNIWEAPFIQIQRIPLGELNGRERVPSKDTPQCKCKHRVVHSRSAIITEVFLEIPGSRRRDPGPSNLDSAQVRGSIFNRLPSQISDGGLPAGLPISNPMFVEDSLCTAWADMGERARA